MNKWLVAGIVSCVPAIAMAQSLRCGTKIISVGTTRGEVTAKCGEPTGVERTVGYTGSSISTGGQPSLVNGASVEVQIEVWTYNFGPQRLMQRIRFEDGIVVRIESLGYGY
jgi:hypothetical protein